MKPARELLQPGDGLLIVDMQQDFYPGGLLAVPEGDRVVPVLNQWINAAREKQIPVYASRDWHPREHVSFKTQGGPWPVHCVQDTPGAAFVPELKLPDQTIVISKGTRFDHDQYSVFADTGFEEKLRQDGIKRLWIGGLALDVCVKTSALDARKAGFGVNLILSATRPVFPEAKEITVEELRQAGVEIFSEN
jgi:nicotinamidase/pyrazinamidase